MTILSIDYIIDVWIDDNGVDKLFTGLHIVSEVTRIINGIEVVSQVDTYLTDPYKVCITDDRYIKITDGCNSFKFDINDSPYTLQELKDLLTACYSCIDVPPDLSDVRRPLVKEGQTEATNADSITETDNVFHLGKSNDGANFATLPANAEYNRQIKGGLKVSSKLTNLQRLIAENTPITLTVWHGVGTDGLDPSAYLNYTNFFATLMGALEVANMLFTNYITINIIGTSVGNPTVWNSTQITSNKFITIQNGNISLSSSIMFQRCYVYFINCTITTPFGGWFNLQASDALFQQCTLNFQYTFLFGLYYGTNLEFRGNTTINFNNDSGVQNLINISSPISGVIKLLGKSTITFNTYGQANKVVNGQIATDTAVKFIIGSKAVVNWGTLDIQGCIVDYSTGIAIGATVGTDIDRTYDLNLFSSTKPVISKNFTSSNPNKSGTLKNIVVDENGVWGVNDGGSGSVTSVNGDSGPDVVLDQDEVLDGAVYKRYSQIEKSKLAGIANGATANNTDANLLNRANHTGSQAESTITGLVSDLAAKAPLNSPAFTGTPTGITKSHVGLGNVDNTSDVNKPVSTLQQTALNLKANLDSPALTGTPSAPTAILGSNTTQLSTTAFVQAAIAALVDSSPGTLDTLNELAAALGDDPNFATTMTNALANKVNISDVLNALNQTVSGKVLDARQGKVLNDLITSLSGTVTTHTSNTSNPHSVTKVQVGLGSVDNTADTAKPVSTIQQTALNLKANLASPTFTGTVGGITKAMVGLTSVDNTSDVAKPVSTAQQTALNLKADIASPIFSGIPAAPTAISGTNTTQLATTAFVTAAVSSGGIVVDNVPTNGSMNAVSSDGTFDALALKSPLASPIFTGLVTTPLIKITGGVPGVGKVLTSDADGDATWETPVAGVTDHTLLSNIGTNTHAQIDSHIANTSNPHSVTKTQVGLSNVPNTDFTSAVAANTAKISYTDAAKVATIETNADVTDTANVTAAGALMDSEVTNLAQVKAFNSADYATSAQGVKADSAVQPSALALKADLASPTFTGTVSGITKAMVGLSNVPNTDFTSAVAANTAKTTNATHTGEVTGSGALTITNGAVTLAKMADMATASLIYRKTAGTGVPEVNTLVTLKTDLGLTGTNSGDQTSIAGITGTKAQFDTAVTDGNIMYIGDAPTAHTHTASAITDFSTAVAANSAVVANTAKVSNIAETTTSIGTLINGATDKPTPIDADYVGLMDSAASNILKKLSWANIKATLKTYFDTLYVALTGSQTIAGVKTFSNSPIVPTPTTNFQAATKKYVDDNAGGGGSSNANGLNSATTIVNVSSATAPSTGQVLTATSSTAATWQTPTGGGGGGGFTFSQLYSIQTLAI